MDRVLIHGRRDGVQSQDLSSALYGFLGFVCRMKVHIIFVLVFFCIPYHSFFPSLPNHWIGSTSPWIFPPRDRSQHLEVLKSPQAPISCLSANPPVPSFHVIGPPPPVDYSPYSLIGEKGPWINGRLFPLIIRSLDLYLYIPGLVFSCKLALLNHFHYIIAVDA